eukprot:788482-Alexandrium_andersonii.AAC.1
MPRTWSWLRSLCWVAAVALPAQSQRRGSAGCAGCWPPRPQKPRSSRGRRRLGQPQNQQTWP